MNQLQSMYQTYKNIRDKATTLKLKEARIKRTKYTWVGGKKVLKD